MTVNSHFRRVALWSLFALIGLTGQFASRANPTGGSVSQGQASFSTSGSVFNINQTSANAFINWQSFNIGSGETVNFNQPSASSVTWNQIGGGSASQILGNINANGYVILQNANGFYIGGSATISAHGLVMTTASTPTINILGAAPWSFSAPPPTAQIVNYGQINISGGGSAFLIAADIVNNGSITAPNGNIGLYAGENVLVSTRPDGRGLNAQVTLPKGSVDNEGNLIADGGTIVAEAQYVNQNGLIQANSVQNNNGTIELVASDDLTLGTKSQISANGDLAATSASEGGFVVLSAGSKFSDTSSSTISASGIAGGQDGVIDILGNGVGTIKSTINDNFAILINPYDMTLSGNPTDTSSSDPNFNVNDLALYSKIDLWSLDNIEISTFWTMPNPSTPATFSLNAGNSIIVDNGCGIGTSFGGSGYDWDINLTAGTQLPYGAVPTAGNYGIYLNGDADIYTLSGNINLWAANEVIVDGGDIGGITTFGGGSISVTAQYGDVNTGNNVNGYDFSSSGYAVDYYLGGISTAAGGNVTINAGGDVISYLPVQSDWNNAQYDGGTGAFGPQPGNVTITAGGNVYGHYVVANGIGTITAGKDIGVPLTSQNQDTEGFALSLINGSWNVFAPNGNIYVQDINNPNGVFGNRQFDYAASSSVLLDAGKSVEITGSDAPLTPPYAASLGVSMPIILPPSLAVIAGGNFILDQSVILFPSPQQNLNLTIVGDLLAPTGGSANLEMSDSAATTWTGLTSFGTSDHASAPPELNNPNPVDIVVGGNIQDVNLYADKVTEMTVIGNMMDSSFIGENMQASDQTTINVIGNIEFSPEYAFVTLPSAILSAEGLMPGTWDSVFDFAVNPNDITAITSFNANNAGVNGLAYYLKQNNYLLFPTILSSTASYGANPGFVYDSSSLQLGFKGKLALSAAQLNALESGSITVLATDSHGNPIINSSGNLEVNTYTFNWGSVLPMLKAESQNDINPTSPEVGFAIGGPGQFNITAASINLGDSDGIVSAGFGTFGTGAPNFASLEGICGTLASGGANVNVTTTSGDLDMASSTICSLDGGNVTVSANKGNINLSQGDFALGGNTPYGIWTSGHSDVNVTAFGDINIGSSRIATFNGGNVFVESYNGSVDCGSGANVALDVWGVYLNSAGLPASVEFGDFSNAKALAENPAPYGSGILAEYPTTKYQTPGATGPGNITVETPNGNITSSSGGIFELALDNSFAGGTVTLTAGTSGTPATADQGNINLGGPVIGGTLNITATGKSQVIALARQDAIITSKEFQGILVALRNATVTAQSVGPTVVIGDSVDANGLGPDAILLSQNLSDNGGAAQSTLGTSVATSTSSQAAAQQSSQQAAQIATTVNSDLSDKKEKPKIKVGRVTVILSSAAPLQKEPTFANSTTAVPVLPAKSSGLVATTR